MKKFFKWFLIISIVAIIGISFTSCDDQLGDDESSVTMQASLSFINNNSSYDLKVNIEDKNGTKTAYKINAGSWQPVYTNLTPPITIKYSPASKVKVSVENTSVYFRNK